MGAGVTRKCGASGRSVREAGFENVWIQPAAGDDGVAIGCAYYGHLAVQKKPRSWVLNDAYFGRGYSEQEIEDATHRRMVRMVTKTTRSDDICRDVAKHL